MDLDDIPYRERDFKLRVDEFKQRDRHHEDQRKASISQAWPRFLASWSLSSSQPRHAARCTRQIIRRARLSAECECRYDPSYGARFVGRLRAGRQLSHPVWVRRGAVGCE